MYQSLEEIIIFQGSDLIKKRDYFSFNRDGSEITYRTDGKSREFGGREKARAYFLVKLIEDYKYPEKNIQLDVEVPKLGSADVIVYKNNLPFIVAECEKEEASKSEIAQAKKQVIEKAKVLKAKYAVAVIGQTRVVFSTQPKTEQLPDLPIGV